LLRNRTSAQLVEEWFTAKVTKSTMHESESLLGELGVLGGRSLFV
jgi:hypothetical protein